MNRQLLAVLMLSTIGSTAVAGEADVIKGLIVDRCADCHVVAGHEDLAADVGAPSFAAIADDRDIYTIDRMRNYLRAPHWPMKQFNLSARDIDRIIAYVEGIRTGQ